MNEENIKVVKGKIVSGVFALTSRTFILQIISFISTFILTILLSPAVFGIFFIVQAIISFLSYFSDIGLAAALIQKKKEPSREELATVFTVQQILVGTIVATVFILAPNFSRDYNLDQDGVFLLQALLVSFFLSSLKTIPSVLIERRLAFNLLVLPQILETSAFYIVAVFLAFKGGGIVSFAWAAVVRGFVGLAAIYLISPWKIAFGISKKAIQELFSFGIPYQMNSILALIKDDLMTIFLGKILPFSSVGYIGWAKKWAEVPLRLIMDSIIRVTFPAFARLQEDKVIFGKALEKSLFFLALLIFPITTVLLLFIKPLVYIIPKYLKWEPALASFSLFASASVFAAFSSPLVNALNAIGKIKVTLKLMMMWTVLTWIFVPFFVYLYGFDGVALCAFIIAFTSVLPAVIMKKYVDFQIIKPLTKPFIATVTIAIPMFVSLPYSQTIMGIATSIFLGLFLYGVIVWFWMKNEISPYLPKFP